MPSKQRQKNSWVAVEDIPQNVLFMMGPPMIYMLRRWGKLGFGDKITQYFTLFKGDFSQMCFLRHELDAGSEFMATKMLANPAWALKVIDKIESTSTLFFKDSRYLKKLNLTKLTNQQLVKIFKKTLKYHSASHGLGPSVTWIADVDKERVTKSLVKMVQDKIRQNNLKLSTPEVFTYLSTPSEISVIQKEERDFLKVAINISRRRKVRETFVQSDLDWLEKELKNVDKNIYGKILKHYKQYAYLPYQYKGPPYSLTDFLGRWQALLREGTNPIRTLDGIEVSQKKHSQKQSLLIKKLKLNIKERQLIKMSQRMICIKDYRKMALYHGMYCYQSFFKEAGKRLGLSFDQVRAMNYWEIPDALLKNKFDAHELNERLNFCIAYIGTKKDHVYTGQSAKDFLKKISFEKRTVSSSQELTGTCACPGKVKGIVKIINIPQEMCKMREGNILVAHNTNPNLVPAMKKAKALISVAGGLTCHAAIVARELKTPCLVGVTSATQVLKDGDKIEVDATKGVIRKIK